MAKSMDVVVGLADNKDSDKEEMKLKNSVF